jgi:hypothetical protein
MEISPRLDAYEVEPAITFNRAPMTLRHDAGISVSSAA